MKSRRHIRAISLTVALIAGLTVRIFANAQFERIQSLVDVISHMDILPEGVQCLGVGDVCGPTIDELGCSTNQFFDLVRSYCTNLCTTGNLENRRERARFKGAMALLDDYSREDSVQTFAYCATNVASPMLAKFAALDFARASGATRAIEFCEQANVWAFPREKKSSICAGVVVAFELEGGSESETNKMIRFGLKVLDADTSYWGGMDETLCNWWPAYATSSNRYAAAVSALQAIPPPASSNYLNRVIAELEAHLLK